MERTRSSTATDATRKRKRGALQDISNNNKKLNSSRRDVKKEVTDGAAKPKAPSATTRRKTTATTVNSALKSSMAATAASKAKKRVPTKKTEQRNKKRKLEGNENQPPVHQKIQTSMLSFQATVKTKEKEKIMDDKENVDVKIEVDNQVLDAVEAAVVKQEILEEIQETETKQMKHEETPETQEQNQNDIEAPAPRNEYAPRPYKFTFDHKDSCFDEDTYAAAVRDIDAPSATMSSHQAKLVHELDTFYRKHEIKYLPQADYIGTVQLDINEKMRTILVDWLVEVSEEYELDSQTFHKAVNLVDRCLKKIKINRKQFQLLGCACMMIAAKFEEVYGPNVEEFVYISDQTYTAEEMLDMEAQVLKALEYRVASTTCYGFMHRYTKAGCTTDKQRALVWYLCDFALLFYHMVRFKPSVLVASAVYLARLMTGEAEPWTPTLHHVTKYNPIDFQDCLGELHRLHVIEFQVVNTQRDKAKAVSEKYMVDKFLKASIIPACSKFQLSDSLDQYTPS
ncbi:Cyclin-A1-1 [Phytophthora citrophthora]|uniref:Cyclin-A1-1 n=1 Tax=Phytophthora citrophthora TaxID=4793 RepID=A0AAD9LC10_9STRA|nr:Cyclin-A1-1 [Phytophthora citrophthora]